MSGPEIAALRNAVLEAITRSDDYHALDGVLAEARAAAVAPLEKALRELRDAAQAFRGNKPYRESDPTEQPLLDALMAADRLLDSAPSPVREPEGLDVERLDRSMAAAGVHIDKARPGPTREIGCQSCREGIAAIAAEYARLSPERPADEALP